MKIIVVRNSGVDDEGTFGRILVSGTSFKGLSLELPWKDNTPFISCIPSGEYKLTLGMYYGGDGVGGKRDYPAYEIYDREGQNLLNGRKLIKIHIANIARQLLGCIAMGSMLGVYKDHWAVLHSRKTFNSFMTAMRGAPVADLSIKYAERH